VRWQHPEMGLISPIKFIPMAEESGLIVPMGEWILRKACLQMKVWLGAGLLPRDTLMCVNLSAKQFDQKNLIGQIRDVIEQTGLPPTNLELEVTESTMIRSSDMTGRVLRQLRELGVKVAIDDFGTGYSSLSHLKMLPLTKLKIDQSFVSDIPADMNDIAIAKAIIALGKSLSLEVLAEGIETEEQHRFMLEEGCDSGQGYHYSKPLPADALERLLHERSPSFAL
jgi:EAL domain-containing protein (putative c-di-GMP-specific phosphodiesterase class I)